MDEKDLDKKLEEFGQKATPEYLIKLHKVKLAERILKGEVGLKKEFEELVELEKQLTKSVIPGAEPAAPSAKPASPASATGGAGVSSEAEEEEIGIPQRLRVKRHYPITDKVLEQRRAAARASRPGSEGNKRNWKGGLFAKDFIEGRIKPCQSTCPIFDDCELVSEGTTKPGGICLDKAAVIQTYGAIMDAIKHKEYDDFNEVSGLMIAEILHTCRTLMEEIMRDGGVVLREKYDKNGVLHSVEYVSHPNLMALPKLVADLGLSPREMNITPKAVKDGKNSEEQGKTLAGIMSDLNRRARGDRDKKAEGGDDE